MANPERDSTQPPAFFVFGPERSGTTLLAFLLSGQPGVFCINDSFVFKCFVDSVMWSRPGLGNRTASSLLRVLPDLVPELLKGSRPKDRSLRDLFYHSQMRKLRRTYSASFQLSPPEVERYMSFLAHRYHADGRQSFLNEYQEILPTLSTEAKTLNPIFLRDVFSATLNHLSAHFSDSLPADAIVGEKTPAHTLYWRWIMDSLYPRSRGVVVVRHPVTNIASIGKRASSASAAEARYLSFSRALVDLASHPRVTVIKYEELVEAPKRIIQHVVDSIGGRAFDPALRLVSYTKDAYTGHRIDPSRNPQPDELFTAEERARIRRRFDHIYTTFEYE